MDFFTVISERHSVRHYTSQPVEAEKLQKVLEAANRAPSAGNLQAFEIYIIRSEAQRQQLALAAWAQDFLAQASVVLVFFTHAARLPKGTVSAVSNCIVFRMPPSPALMPN